MVTGGVGSNAVERRTHRTRSETSYVQLPTSADNVTLFAYAADCWPCSSLAAGQLTAANPLRSAVRRPDDCTDGQTDRRSTISLTLLRMLCFCS